MTDHQHLLDLNRQLLDSIAERDWGTYSKLVDPSLTCFEPEARGHFVEGLAFHQFYFELESSGVRVNTTMSSPHVRFLGEDVAIVCFVRLIQMGTAEAQAYEETRVWHRVDGVWKHVHLHRSIGA